ncbi:hypothetical protein KVR01_007706 [Diaporthe batatas]|uniref:uncharacterized protein n=1 Tax=Diaporthe batatas TaxID=748121 RepID=UPI001D059BC8|nr:uncharacterized protein KVR01_007706 [Diaporthe batatas]KAG8161941.1 hypothetical protein KVR01_007706 [Diaporthe batatas]
MNSSALTARRTRTSTPRTRSGCGICRKRHIKCDEARPSCLRCSRAGWTCDGYAADKAIAIASPSQRDAGTLAARPAIPITSYAIPFKVPGSQRDRQILHYFCVQGAHEIASHFNVDFWTNVVLQQSHQHYVVRQALVSLSSLHLECATRTSNKPCRNKPEVLIRYGKAVHALRKRIQKPDPDTIKAALTCCVLFYCFEAALGDSWSAMRHLDAGLDLLLNHCRGQKLENDEHMGALSRVFESLDLQATIFHDARVPRMRLSIEDGGDHKAFRDLNEGYGTFKRLQNSLFHFLTTYLPFKFCDKDSLPDHVAQQKGDLEDQLCLWLARFEETNFTRSADKSEYPGARLLLIQWHVSKMLIESNYPVNDGVFGSSPNPRAEKVLSMIDELRHYSQGRATSLSRSDVGERRTFSSESGVVGPLFALAAKCTDENVCNRAFELLTTSRRREGLYDSGNMAEIIRQFRAAKDQKKVNDLKQIPMMIHSALSLETLFEQKMRGIVGGMDELVDSLQSGPSCYKSAVTQARRLGEEQEHKPQDSFSEAAAEGVDAVDATHLPAIVRYFAQRDVGVPDFAQRYTADAI